MQIILHNINIEYFMGNVENYNLVEAIQYPFIRTEDQILLRNIYFHVRRPKT